MPQSAFDLSANQAAAVLSLLERAEVPPFPVYYGLLFDYVAGTPSLVGSRIGSILDDGKGEAAERLYSEFVAPYENREPLERAIDSMVSRLRMPPPSCKGIETAFKIDSTALPFTGLPSNAPFKSTTWIQENPCCSKSLA